MRTLTLILLFIPLNLFSQKKQFEGIIKFSQTYQSENAQFDLKKYQSFFGDSYVSYVKPGLYRQDYYNSNGISFILYNFKTNQYYYKLANIDTLYYQDCSKPKGEFKLEKTDTIINILNYRCNSLIVKSQSYNAQYFYAKDLYIDPAFFKDHKFGGYNLITAATESVYLKIISDFGFVKVIAEADSIVEKKLDDNIFKLPNLPMKEK